MSHKHSKLNIYGLCMDCGEKLGEKAAYLQKAEAAKISKLAKKAAREVQSQHGGV